MRYLVCILFLCSCQTVTIRPHGGKNIYTSRPDYKKSHPFFLGGLVGTAKIDVDDICGSRKAVQMQTQKTFKDAIIPTGVLALTLAGGISVGLARASLYGETVHPEGIILTATIWTIIGSFLGSIYTPKTAKVWCEKDNLHSSLFPLNEKRKL